MSLIVGAFDKQFTPEQFNDGIRFDQYDKECKRLFHQLLGIENDMNLDGNAVEGK